MPLAGQYGSWWRSPLHGGIVTFLEVLRGHVIGLRRAGLALVPWGCWGGFDVSTLRLLSTHLRVGLNDDL